MNRLSRSAIVLSLLAAVTVAAESARAAVILTYTFDDAPLIATAQTLPINRTSSPTSLVGVTASDFAVYVSSATSKSVVIAKAADSSFTAAQLSGTNNNTFNFTDGPYAEFTVNNVAALTSLSVTARGGYEWNTSGTLSSQSNRWSEMVLRTSLDNFTANVGAAFLPGTGTNQYTWDTDVIDLSGLNLGSETSVTFRLATRSTSGQFHRTQIDAVLLEGTAIAIPEPHTLAVLGLAGLTLVRRSRR